MTGIDIEAITRKIELRKPLDDGELKAVTEAFQRLATAIGKRLNEDAKLMNQYINTVLRPQFQAAARAAAQLYNSLPEETRKALRAEATRKAK